MKALNITTGRYSFPITIAALLLAGAVQIANASLIDVNFYTTVFVPPGAPGVGAAAIGGLSDFWNGVDPLFASLGSVSSLADYTGVPTGTTLTYNTFGGGGVTSLAQSPLPNPIMNDYLFNNTHGDIIVTLGNLVPSTVYDLFVYVASNDAVPGQRGALVNANGALAPAIGLPSPAFAPGQNFVQLTPTSSAAGVITITESDLAGVNNFGEVDMNGLQLVGPFNAAVAVPEPATVVAGTLMLLPLGVSALRFVGKRKMA
jgi:hypothetical protein